ncbi:MORN motif protein (macronuclear) [Tetrahymena thermophila SB210]|uniref:MORN motif protein n=1 Tax=Tetrahymena thermophila (strain SB210) TaxID=312017 RepID=Q22RS3_TETTS|nr:MORN motif protein [Tetrahymena thermophila SB210]EAR88049.2 MORN motif protein [Tetrahymena thermophila SB210]|eukprot:XP_001008294.2 MORN motif protein [Tetrahymena thermophila SB210]
MQFEQLIENSTVKDLKINYKKDYRENYKLVRDETIYGLSVCKTYIQKNIKTNEMFLCVQETFYDHQSPKIINMLETLQVINENPFFNQFRAFSYEELQQKSVRIYILIEYYDMNLIKIAKKRTLIDKNLIDSLTKCFLCSIQFLFKIESSLLAIHSSNVFLKQMSANINDGYLVKILYFPFMQSSFDMVLSGKEKHYNCYLSVEELECLDKKLENIEINNTQSNIFSFGALLLDLLNCANPNANGISLIYCKDSYRIDETNFFERINFVAEKYPKRVFLLLEQLLKFNDRQTPRQIMKLYENQSQINNSQIADDTIANAKQRIQMQLYSEFPIKSNVVNSPSNYNFAQKQKQNTLNNNNNSSEQQTFSNSAFQSNQEEPIYYNNNLSNNQNKINNEFQNNEFQDRKYNQQIQSPQDFQSNKNNNQVINPLGSSSQFDQDSNRNQKTRSKWDIPSIHNSGSRQFNPIVTPFSNNQLSPTERNEYANNIRYAEDSPTFANQNNISPSYQLSSESGNKNQQNSLYNQNSNNNDYNQFLFQSIDKDAEQKNRKFAVQGRGEDNQVVYKKQPDQISSEYFKPNNSSSNNQSQQFDFNFYNQIQNDNDKYMNKDLPSIQIQKVESNYENHSQQPNNNKNYDQQNSKFLLSPSSQFSNNDSSQQQYSKEIPQAPQLPSAPSAQSQKGAKDDYQKNTIPQAPLLNENSHLKTPQVNTIPQAPSLNTIPLAPPLNGIQVPKTNTIPPAPQLAGIPPAPFIGGIPPAPPIGGIPPAPPIGNTSQGSQLNGIPPAPQINGIPKAPPLLNGIPSAPPMSILQEKNKNNQQPIQHLQSMIQNSLEVTDENNEQEQIRKKEEVLQRLFQNNNQAAPVRLPFFLPNQGVKKEIKDENNAKQADQKEEIKNDKNKELIGIPPAPQNLIPPPPPLPLSNILVDTNYVVKPKLEADTTVRDEQKERIENHKKTQNQLKKESNDALLQSQSVLESSQRLIDKASKVKLPENQTYSTTILEEDENSANKKDTLDTYRTLKARENEYLNLKQQNLMKSQQQINLSKEEELKKIRNNHSQLLDNQNQHQQRSIENSVLNASNKGDFYNNRKYQDGNNQIQNQNESQQQSNLYASFNPDSQEKSHDIHSFNENSVAVFDNEGSLQNQHKLNFESIQNEREINHGGKDYNRQNDRSDLNDNQQFLSPQKKQNKVSSDYDLESYRNEDNQSSWRFRQTPPQFQDGYGFENGITQYQMNNSQISNQDNNFRSSQIDQSAYKFPTNVIQVINSIGGSLNQSSDQSSSIVQEAIRYNQQQEIIQQLYPNLNNSESRFQNRSEYLQESNFQPNVYNNQYDGIQSSYQPQKNQFQQKNAQNQNNSPESTENTYNSYPYQKNNQNQPQNYQLNSPTTQLNSSQNNLNSSSYTPSSNFQKNSLYKNNDFIEEQSQESEPEEQNSLIYKSPIQKNVKDYMSQLQKNKEFFEQLRKQRPQGSKQFDPQEFEQIVQQANQEPDKKGVRNSYKNSSQDSGIQSYLPQVDQVVENNFEYPQNQSNQNSTLDSYIEKTIDEQIYEDNKNLFFSEFQDFQDKEALIAELYQQLQKFPDTKKIQYKNKSFYEGQVQVTDRSIVRNGFGILKMQNGDIYCGYFKNNQFDGEGVYFYNHGDIYRGQLRKDLRQGHGTYYYHGLGFIYSGEWNGNVKEGYGRLLMKNKEKYEGYFKQNVKCGRGIYYFANGDTFDGEWVYDKKCGFGTLEFKDGNHFEGNFYDDLPYGQGQMKFKNGDEYSGNYEDGLISGYGIYIHANQQYYEGDFSKNQMNGEGIYYFKNGDKYQGQYIDGIREGYGKYFYQNGCIYEGQWVNNQKHGEGRYIFPDNTYYQGSFENSMKSGIGKQTFKENEFYNGQWRNDKRNGKGFYQFKDGSYYEGDWLNDKMHGEGTYNLKTSSGFRKIYGIWSDDELYQSFE